MRTTRKVLVAVLIFCAGATVASHYRRNAAGDYGRLFDKQLPVTPQPVVTRTIPVVTEAPAPPATPDPMLTESQAPAAVAAPPPPPIEHDQGHGLAIVGDTNGVSIVRAEAARPKLSGGIFRAP